MKLSLISKYRKQLMTFSMIWLAIRHSNFPNFINKAFHFIFYSSGYGGADAFVFLSGFGIYFACKRKDKYSVFIKRRLIKIFPYSIFVYLVLYLLKRIDLNLAILNAFGLSAIFRQDWSCWYISFILIMYLLSPIYFRLFEKRPYICTIIGIAIATSACLLMDYVKFYIFFRTNLYLIGMLLGYLYDKNPDINVWWLLPIMCFGWWLEYYLFHTCGNTTLYTPPFLFIIPGFMLLLAYLIDKIKFIQKPMAWMSTYTLQFYLVHEEIVFFVYGFYSALYRPGIHFDFLINIFCIVLAFLISIIYKNAIDLVINTMAKIKKQYADKKRLYFSKDKENTLCINEKRR